MSTVLICRDALEDSVLSNLALARATAQGGEAAAVVFTAAALDALADGTFEWSWNFRKRDIRTGIIAKAEEKGLSFGSAERDGRWADTRALARSLADEPNLRLIACPFWTHFLNLQDAPDYLERIDEAQLVALLGQADTIVGSY